VGWLERICHELHARLLVLLPEDPATTATARIMAQRVTDRGGPAIIVAPPPATLVLQTAYAELVHDRPLDWIVSSATPGMWDDSLRATLWADTARAEALRVSTAFRPIVDLTQQLVIPSAEPGVELAVADRLDFLTDHSDVPSTNWLRSAWRKAGRSLLDAWDQSSFILHESDGVLPMQRAVLRMRDQLHIAETLQVELPGAAADLAVTPRLAQHEDNGVIRQISQFDEIERYRPVLVSVGVGPYDELIAVADAVALLHEAAFPDPDQSGSWLDIGVVSLGTTVVGESIQRLWLPRGGTSEQATFAVHPGRRKSWRVRLCVYRDNLLLQALLVAGVSGPEEPTARRRLLARQLGLPPDSIPDEGMTWYARTEYSLTAGDLQRIPGGLHRTVGITANTIDNAKVLMFKGDDLAIEVRLKSDIDVRVAAAREDLSKISTPPKPGVHPNDLQYGFNNDNTAVPGGYTSAMISLASRGWALYESFVPQDSRARLAAALNEGNGSIVSVGHLLVEHVLPWSIVYDRPFDKRKQNAEFLACKALHDDGELPNACGVLSSCPLNPARQEERVDQGKPAATEPTVACPRHFWGFRHIIELPATRAHTVALATTGSTGPISAGFGQHHDLSLVDDHLKDLAALVNAGQPPIPWQHGNRDQFQEALQTGLDVDLVYLFCHAGYDGPDEVIRLRDAQDPAEGLLAASDLAGDAFRTQPLIFVNGCRTAGFNPKALSPFITTLVTDRNASGLVGTEIDVWEQLAAEVGREFIGRLCKVPGMTVGRALRETRLSLLAKGNPLGLAYTLYALADLRLRP
jgi:hypothetical protein